MAINAPAFVTVNPSYTMPEFILPNAQASGAFELLAGGEPQVRLGEGDLYVYMKRMEVRTKVAAGQSAANQLPGVGITLSQFSTPTYLFRARAEWDHHDAAAASRWNVSIEEAHRLALHQAFFQLLRNAELFGMNPANGEGLLNTNGATAVTLPADQNGNQTVVTYDNGGMAQFFLSQFVSLKTRTNQLGMARNFTVLGPQRTLGAFELANIVQLTQYQRPGAGSETTAGVIKNVLEAAGDKITWVYDDTLIGKGAGGTDAVVIAMTEVSRPLANARFNTNAFATLSPGVEACTLQLVDMPAPREITAQLPGGGVDVLAEMRATSGWAVRPECLTIVSMQYQ